MIKFIREIFGRRNDCFYYGNMIITSSGDIDYMFSRDIGYRYTDKAYCLLHNIDSFWIDDTDYLNVSRFTDDVGNEMYNFKLLNLYGYSKLLVQLTNLGDRGLSLFKNKHNSAMMSVLCGMYQMIDVLESDQKRKVLNILECDEFYYSHSGAKTAFEIIRDIVEGIDPPL